MSPKVLKPRLIIISAPSGAGKTTLCEKLIKEFPAIRLSISTTTRKRRDYETEGVHYHFVEKEVFEEKKSANEFAEWALVHGNLYGTSKKVIERFLAEGSNVLFDIDVQGAMSLKALYPERALLVFIHPPSLDVLQQRLKGRKSESGATLETRLQNAYNELGWSQKFDYQITNDDLDRAYAELKAIVTRECL